MKYGIDLRDFGINSYQAIYTMSEKDLSRLLFEFIFPAVTGYANPQDNIYLIDIEYDKVFHDALELLQEFGYCVLNNASQTRIQGVWFVNKVNK